MLEILELKIAKRLSESSCHRFVKGAMNIVDLLGILPYFTSLILSLVTVSENFSNPSTIVLCGLLAVLRTFCLRVVGVKSTKLFSENTNSVILMFVWHS